MSELLRILRYVRPYTPSLLVSVLLMAFAGAAHGLIALLIQPIFDRARAILQRAEANPS